jgi:eukaryotic-like serine/threonine-protein kinase
LFPGKKPDACPWFQKSVIGGEDLETHRITQSFEPNRAPGQGEQLQAGLTLANRYLIQGVIGVGGMGAVYRARDLHFPNVDKRVAVKEMVNQAREPSMRETIVRNFEREANILATLSHPSIPRIYDYFTQDERSYLILEFVAGKDLETILADMQGFIPVQQVVAWAIELCEVLDYLHNHKPEPIIFRDMKPSNIMVNHSGHIVLVDFGIAKPFQTGLRGTMIGTEGYSPPEQYRGEATPLVDIYALGATLHHVLTRRDPRLEAPFSFGDRPIRQINPAVSPELEGVINKAVSYAPEERMQSIKEFKEALQFAAQATGLLPITPVRPVVHEEKNRLLWKFECEDEVRGGLIATHQVLLGGSYDFNLYALNPTTGDFIWKYATEGGIVSKPALHEGQIFFGSEDKNLHVVHVRSGKQAWTYPTGGPVRSSPLVAEGHVFFGSDDGYLYAINAVSGRQIWRVDMGDAIRSTPVYASDRILVGSESGDFFALDLGGNVKWRYKAKRGITSSALVSQGMVLFSSLDGALYCLDLKSGWVVWRFRLGKGSISTPSLADNTVFVGSVDGYITGVDLRSAKELWRYKTEHQVTGSAVVYGDALYCGSVDGHLYCLEHKTGRLRWKYQTQGPITGTPTFHQDAIYIGSTDHHIYALSV